MNVSFMANPPKALDPITGYTEAGLSARERWRVWVRRRVTDPWAPRGDAHGCEYDRAVALAAGDAAPLHFLILPHGAGDPNGHKAALGVSYGLDTDTVVPVRFRRSAVGLGR